MTRMSISGPPNLGFPPAADPRLVVVRFLKRSPLGLCFSVGPPGPHPSRPAKGEPQTTLCGSPGQDEIAAGGGADRRSAKNADAPMNQSREAHHSAWPHHSPSGHDQRERLFWAARGYASGARRVSAGSRVGVEGLGHSEIGWTGRAAELASEAARAQGASPPRHNEWPAAGRHVSIRRGREGGREFRPTA
jgi:hypothetical protein